MLQTKAKVSIALPELPYMENALEPVISARTISIHYGKHHAGYVDKLNDLIAGTPFDGRPLAEIVVRAADDPKSMAIFHNAAQTWNHAFYWHSMRAKGGGARARSEKPCALARGPFGSRRRSLLGRLGDFRAWQGCRR
jgi:Fe-Mn family superoxide dismutase